jgi:hypothetical protein
MPFNDDQLYFFQLPAVLPRFKLPREESTMAEEANGSDQAVDGEGQSAAAQKAISKEKEDKAVKVTDAEFDQAQEGRIGSLMVYKSGKMKLKVGSVLLEVCIMYNGLISPCHIANQAYGSFRWPLELTQGSSSLS